MFQPSVYSQHPANCPYGCCTLNGDMGLPFFEGASASDIQQAYGISSDLAQAIVRVANRVGISDPAMLANVINFESRFDHRAVNPGSGATGLIQFMPRTAQELGTTTSALRGMSAVQQMEYVARYFELPRIKSKGPFRTQLDTMMAIFYPEAVGRGATYPFSPTIAAQNHGITTAGAYLAMAMQRAKLQPNDSLAGTARNAVGDLKRITLISLAGLGIGLVGYGLYRYTQTRAVKNPVRRPDQPTPTNPSLYWVVACDNCGARVWLHRQGGGRPPFFCCASCKEEYAQGAQERSRRADLMIAESYKDASLSDLARWQDPSTLPEGWDL